jgi:hypothetical protein
LFYELVVLNVDDVDEGDGYLFSGGLEVEELALMGGAEGGTKGDSAVFCKYLFNSQLGIRKCSLEILQEYGLV